MKTAVRQFFFGSSLGDNTVMHAGWLLFRVHAGLSIAIHAGWPKMNSIAAPGWFVDQVAGLGFTFPSPAFWASMASWGEFVGGIFIALGLLTRFSALQLAFQFFVIAFLWYDNPEPLTGMYFQHSLFWTFVVLTFGGAGRYSLDHLILARKKWKKNPVPKIAVTSMFILLVHLAGAQPVVHASDFITGDWKGTLTYRDYKTGEPYSMPVEIAINVNKADQQQLIFTFTYPGEPKANGNDTLRIGDDGTQFDGAKVISRSWDNKERLVIITEMRGIDGNDNRPALVRYIYIIGRKQFVSRKEILFDHEQDYIVRHEYVMER